MVKRLINKFADFAKTEASSGVLLGIAAILAFALSQTSAAEAYFSALDYKLFGLTIKYWINDGLMALFFFVIGLEIKRELTIGHLSSPQKAALPLAAALGGMLVPAALYFAFNPTGPASAGWGIPMATDIAFALGVLTLFGSRVPVSLKVFLLALAIVDDLGAILVIAFFYTSEIKGAGLGLAAGAFGIIAIMRSVGVRNYLAYFAVGSIVWLGFLYSGVHATIAGVLLGLLAPVRFPVEKGSEEDYSPLDELIHALHPYIAFGVMPIFAFANAGVRLDGVNLNELSSHPVTLGIAAGLIFGKPLGVLICSFIVTKLNLAKLPEGITWSHITAVGFLAGIGFTMSLFISGLAMTAEMDVYSKVGIMGASLVAGLVGAAILKWSLRTTSST